MDKRHSQTSNIYSLTYFIRETYLLMNVRQTEEELVKSVKDLFERTCKCQSIAEVLLSQEFPPDGNYEAAWQFRQPALAFSCLSIKQKPSTQRAL